MALENTGNMSLINRESIASPSGRRFELLDLSLPAVLFLLTFTYRLPDRVTVIFDWDNVQYLLGLVRFDPAAHQPHPPGYPLFMALGWISTQLVGDPQLGLIYTTVFIYSVGVVCVYFTGKRLFDRFTGGVAGLILFASPLANFFLSFPNTFSVEAGLSAILWLVYAEWIVNPRPRYPLLLPWALGLLAGFRPSFLGFALLPTAYLLLARRRDLLLKSVLHGVIAILIWLVPLVILSGGPLRYYLALQAETVPFVRSLSVENILYNLDQIRKTSFGMLGYFAVLPVLYGIGAGLRIAFSPKNGAGQSEGAKQLATTAFLWFLVPLVFFIKNFTHPGYLCFFLPVLALGLARCLVWIAGLASPRNERLRTGLIAVLAALVAFLLMYQWTGSQGEFFSRVSVRNSEKRVSAFLDEMKAKFPLDRTAIVSLEHFRQVQWYLPQAWAVFPQAAYRLEFGTDPARTNLYCAHGGIVAPGEWHFMRSGPIHPIILPPEVDYLVVSPGDFELLGNPEGFLSAVTSAGEGYMWKHLSGQSAITMDHDRWVVADLELK
jgi:hypothetical protein